MDEKEIEVWDIADGKLRKRAKCLGDWGVIEVRGCFVVVHLPSGNSANMVFEAEPSAIAVVEEINQLRNSWDLSMKSIEKFHEQLKEIFTRHRGVFAWPKNERSEEYNLNGYDGKPMEV